MEFVAYAVGSDSTMMNFQFFSFALSLFSFAFPSFMIASHNIHEKAKERERETQGRKMHIQYLEFLNR